MFPACTFGPRKATILIISRDQSDTVSLNPSRLRISSDLALRNSQAIMPKGTQIRHHFITYTGEGDVGVKAAESYLDTDPSVMAIVGDISSPSTRFVAELANRRKLVHLSVFATEDAIFQEYPWSFSYRSTLDQEQSNLITLLKDHLHASRIALFRTDNPTINPRIAPLLAKLKAAGMTVVSDIMYDRDTQDFKPDLARTRWADVETALLFLSASQTNHILQQMQQTGVAVPVYISTASLSVEAFHETAPIQMEMYTLLPSMYLSIETAADPVFVAFKSQYQVAMGNNRFDTGGFWAYDGFRLLHELVQQVKTPEELRMQLVSYDKGRLVGRIRFDAQGSLRDNTFKLIRLIGGEYEVLDK